MVEALGIQAGREERMGGMGAFSGCSPHISRPFGLEIRYYGYKCCIGKELKCVFCAKMRFPSGY